MSAIARFELQLDAADKQSFARAAALSGTTMAAFVRGAAKEKAAALIEREHAVNLSLIDFRSLHEAISKPYSPNAALKKALKAAAKVRRA